MVLPAITFTRIVDGPPDAFLIFYFTLISLFTNLSDNEGLAPSFSKKFVSIFKERKSLSSFYSYICTLLKSFHSPLFCREKVSLFEFFFGLLQKCNLLKN